MGSNRETSNIADAILENEQFDRAPKIVSHFGAPIIF